MALQPGDFLDNGRYRIVRILGRGGYGFVYLAGDNRLREPVAIKELLSALVDDQATVRRFVQEARATMRLTHPNLVHTRDVFQEGDNWYAVMDYLPGGPLSERLGHGPLPVDEALHIMADLCEGLAYAHAQGVVHCDLKPANVLFDERGRARLADFGIAHIPADLSSRSWRTDTGFAAGTLCYMSPEQTDGVRDDPRVDVYALGVLLYEMLAGRRYLEFDTRNTPSAQAKNIDAIKTQMPESLADVPSTLNAVVLRALSKQPEDRYADAALLAAALSHVVLDPVPPPSPAVTAVPAARSRLRPKVLVAWLVGMTGLVVVALIVGILWWSGVIVEPLPTPPTPTETPAPMPIEVALLQLPVLAGTSIPRLAAAISPENADQVVQLARWGKGTVEVVAYSPDGSLLAVASSLGIYLYDAETLEEMRLIETDNSLTSIAFSPDGQTLASGEWNGTVQLWRVSDGELLRTLEGHTLSVNTVTFSPDGQTLASAAQDGPVRLWRVSDGALLRTLEGRTSGFGSSNVAFSPDGQTLASTGEGTTVQLWRVSDGEVLRTLQGHTAGVSGVAFSPDGQTLASGSWDHTVRLWQISDGALLRILDGNMWSVGSIAFSPDGQTLASGGQTRAWDGNVQLWRVSDGELLHSMNGHTDEVSSVAFSPDGQTLASGSRDYTVRLWRVSDGALLRTLEGYTEKVRSVAFAPDGQIMASGWWDGNVRLWEIPDGALSRTLKGHTGEVWSVAFSPDGQILASGAGFDFVRLWRVSDGALLRTLEGQTEDVKTVTFSPDGQILAVGGGTLASGPWGGSVQLWRVSDGALLRTLTELKQSVHSVAFSPDGQILATGAVAGILQMWRVSDGELLRTLEGHTDWVASVAFSSDGQTLASGGWYDPVRLWRVSDGELLRVLKVHTGGVNSLAFAPDDQTLASGSDDCTVRLWRVSDGELLHTLEGHTNGVYSVAFSPDGQTLASGSYDGTVRLWGIPDGMDQQETPQPATPSPSLPSPKPTPGPSDVPAFPTAALQPTAMSAATSTRQSGLQFTGAIIWDPLVAPNCSGPAISRQSIVQDAYGNPVDGVRVQVDCYGNTWFSHPSGTPGEYETGHYDFSLGQSAPQDWTCTARVYDVNGQPVDSSEIVNIHFDTNDCNSGSGHQVAIVNWTMHWASIQTPMPVPNEMPSEPLAGGTWTRPSDGMVMVYIPADGFLMGSTNADNKATDDEKPQHRVSLDAFWIDKMEVTNAQYRRCVEAGTCRAPTACDWGEPTFADDSKTDHPVVCVSWDDARMYCEWAGARLPTEAEWERVARGHEGRIFPWGDEFDCGRGNFDDEQAIDDYVVPGGANCDSYTQTALVGSYPTGVGTYGVLDMAGNVWEWVNDWYGKDYYASSPARNPEGPGAGQYRVLRGGGWYSYWHYARAAHRGYFIPTYRCSYLGIRCAATEPGG